MRRPQYLPPDAIFTLPWYSRYENGLDSTVHGWCETRQRIEINDPSSTSTSAPREGPTLDPLDFLYSMAHPSVCHLSSLWTPNQLCISTNFHNNSKVNYRQSLQMLILAVVCRGRYVALGLHSSNHASRMFASQLCSNFCSTECALMIFWMWSCLSLKGMSHEGWRARDSSGTVYNTSLASMSLC